MTYQGDPLDSLPSDVDDDAGILPAPEPIEFPFPLVSKRTKEDLEKFGVNVAEDYRISFAEATRYVIMGFRMGFRAHTTIYGEPAKNGKMTRMKK